MCFSRTFFIRQEVPGHQLTAGFHEAPRKLMWPTTPTSIPDSWRRSGGAALADAIKKASTTTKQAYVWKRDGVDEQMDFSEAHANTDKLCAARAAQFCVAFLPPSHVS